MNGTFYLLVLDAQDFVNSFFFWFRLVIGTLRRLYGDDFYSTRAYARFIEKKMHEVKFCWNILIEVSGRRLYQKLLIKAKC